MIKARIKEILARTFTAISPKLYVYSSYLRNRGFFPNLKTPRNIAEIVLSNILSGKVNEYATYVDKVEVRKHIESWGYGQYLPKIYGVWENVEDIDFESFPSSFALKTNHGCGSHYICSDKTKLDKDEAKRIIQKALNTKFGTIETQYHQIRPLVFCEEYIDDGSGNAPKDYKFMCLDGEIKSILMVTERFKGGFTLITYDENWSRLDYIVDKYNSPIELEKPTNLDLMIKIAKDISSKFDFVRVDFYDIGDRIYIGELTFTPQGGKMTYFSNEALVAMGRK